jgi:hypothetical protein
MPQIMATPPIIKACECGQTAFVHFLLAEHKADLKVPAVNPYWALHVASEKGNRELLQVLIEVGNAPVDAPNRVTFAPLSIFCIPAHGPSQHLGCCCALLFCSVLLCSAKKRL